jgi:SAM-dependent methyltransferase
MADNHELDSREEWKNIEIFDNFAQGRNLVRAATTNVIRVIVEKNIDPYAKILELGSGIGELSNHLGQDYQGRIIEVEQSTRALGRRRLNDSSGVLRLIQGSILQLPIADNTQQNVISLAAFDTIDNIDLAALEVARTMQTGGRFIHLLDLMPHGEVVMRHLPQDQIPFPAYTKEGSTHMADGFQLIPKNAYPLLRTKLDEKRLPIYDQYASDPIGTFRLLHEQAPHLAYKMAEDIEEYLKKIRITGAQRTPAMHMLFGQRLSTALENAGVEVIQNGEVTADVTISNESVHKTFPNKNVFINRTGREIQQFSSQVPLGQVKEISTLHVLIAKKK